MKETACFGSPTRLSRSAVAVVVAGWLSGCARRDWKRPLTEFATTAMKKGEKE
jgi:hypothetical protein